MNEGNGELMPESRLAVVLRMGIFTVEKDALGRYHVSIPDGKREEGLTADELRDLGKVLRKVARFHGKTTRPTS
jgi:hypothetical protein